MFTLYISLLCRMKDLIARLKKKLGTISPIWKTMNGVHYFQYIVEYIMRAPMGHLVSVLYHLLDINAWKRCYSDNSLLHQIILLVVQQSIMLLVYVLLGTKLCTIAGCRYIQLYTSLCMHCMACIVLNVTL